jgi:DHA1 family multidrug resistance protein-like MFS transporter/DHA1 family quinolone resistance protein-like MFS transporter
MILKGSSYIRKVLKSSIGKSFIIFPSAFLTATGLCMIELGIIFYIKEIFGATPSQIGYFTALWSFCYIIGCIFIRPLFNKVLPRYLLIGSSIFMCLFILMILYIKVFTYAFLYYDLYGLAMSFFWPPIMGWLSQDVEGTRLGKSMSFFNLTWSGGIIIGPLLAGILSAISPEIPLLVGSALFFLTGVIIAGGSVLLPQIRTDRGNDQFQEGETGRVDMSTVLRYPGWIGLFTTFVVIGMLINIFPVFARDELLLKKELIGLLMQSRTFIATFVFVFLSQTTFWHFRISPMITGQICLACLVVLMNFTSSPLILALLIAFIGALRALSYNSSIFHGVSGSINRTGRVAIHESLLAAGLIFGSSLGGVIYQRYSMTVVYYFCGAIVFFGAVIQSGLYLSLKKPNNGIIRDNK